MNTGTNRSQPATTATDPNPSQPVDVDYGTLAGLVETKIKGLHTDIESLIADVVELVQPYEQDLPIELLDRDVVPRSPDEIIVQLNAIGAASYWLARNIRPLARLRDAFFAADAAAARRPTPPQ